MSETFPKTLYVQAGAEAKADEGRDYFGMAKLETMNDGDGARDDEEIAVYELKAVKVCKVTRELVDE